AKPRSHLERRPSPSDITRRISLKGPTGSLPQQRTRPSLPIGDRPVCCVAYSWATSFKDAIYTGGIRTLNPLMKKFIDLAQPSEVFFAMLRWKSVNRLKRSGD